MKITHLIEGAVLLLLSLAGLAEGLRLVIYKDPYTVYDPLGPGLYIIAIGLGLMVLAIIHLIVQSRTAPVVQKVRADKTMRTRLISTVAACAVTIFLIHIIGYLPATVLFFLLQFRIQGIRSWPRVVALSVILSGLYYLVFVQYCGMVFPAGPFFK